MPHTSQERNRPQRKTGVRDGLRRLLDLCQNGISAVGLTLVGGALLLLITYALFVLFVPQPNPYFDIVGLLILPGVFVLGLIIVPIGVLREYRRRRHAPERPAARAPRIDFNDSRTRAAVAIFGGVTFFVVLPTLAVTGYESYHYTESTEFCGQVCHTVMKPQATAHATSAHARVSCAECHIGAGADWFVKSKLSGTRQVFAVWFDTFPRPIPPAITELRPARETCEECHWPARFFGAQYREYVHYAPDKQNRRHVVRMVLNTGGGDPAAGTADGIHMHMMVAGRVEYVATDELLQEIPWTRYVRPDGSATVYRSDGQPHDAPRPAGTFRTIDCMDCHNRGAHHFQAPQTALDLKLEAGQVDANLPFIKREAVQALLGDYTDPPAASRGIARHLREYYDREYPQIAATRPDAIQQAVAAIQDVYERNFFPVMNVDWRTYPENVGHLYSAGCFRCHDGLHVDTNGSAITSACNVCHTFLNPMPERRDAYVEGTFQHSMPLDKHVRLRCSACHDGGRLQLCYQCHDSMGGLDDSVPARFRHMQRDAQYLR